MDWKCSLCSFDEMLALTAAKVVSHTISSEILSARWEPDEVGVVGVPLLSSLGVLCDELGRFRLENSTFSPTT
jgi:hypothetical protein